jgi:hypothetical protein
VAVEKLVPAKFVKTTAIAFLFLDEGLGEYDVETRVGQVNVDSVSKAPAQSYSLEALPKAVDALFASGYPGLAG